MVERWTPRWQNTSNAASRMRELVVSWSSTTPSTAAVSAPAKAESALDADGTFHPSCLGSETNPCDVYHTCDLMADAVDVEGVGVGRRAGHRCRPPLDLGRGDRSAGRLAARSRGRAPGQRAPPGLEVQLAAAPC